MIRFTEHYVPDGDEARRWAEEELSHPRYADAKPTWFDYWARDIADFLMSLFSPEAGENAGGAALVIVTIVVLAAIVTALILWGRPRASERSHRRGGDLLGESDDRTASQLRSDAERSAKAGDWDAATILRFRALARGLLERDIISPAPGATAQAIAREASRALAGEEDALRAAAGFFDDVRYLGRTSSEERYRALAATDDRLRARHPAAVSA